MKGCVQWNLFTVENYNEKERLGTSGTCWNLQYSMLAAVEICRQQLWVCNDDKPRLNWNMVRRLQMVRIGFKSKQNNVQSKA